jgi:hypothetical protein
MALMARDRKETRRASVVHGDAWSELIARIDELHPIVYGNEVPADPLVRAEGLRYLLRFLAAGIAVCVEHDDTETPELGRMTENRASWGLDNPDCLYSYTRIRPDARYRLAGTLGTACHTEIQVNTGHYADGDLGGWQAVSAITADDLVTADDGTFEVVLSDGRDRPAGAANWLALDDRASFLVLRQYFDDWEHERSADVYVEQVDYPYPPPTLTTDRIETELALLGQWLETGSRTWASMSRGILRNPPGDVQPFLPPASSSGLKGQAYGFGAWRCAPDEAVIIELTPPAAKMWGVSLADRFWQSIDFASRQSSLNGHQATLVDGRFVAVISHDDPGVANWLDPGGHTEGTIAVRYLFATELPPMRYRRVSRVDLSDDPAVVATPTVTAAERRDTLERRRRAVTRRYRR